MQRFSNTVIAFLGSRTFLRIVFIFFILECVWVAISAAYPMAFDEEYHLGLINVYSQHWLPFLSDQPPNANQFGAVARDPSFLYHWLMSFPSRAFMLLTDSQTAQVIFLRLINIGIVGASLALFVRAMRRMGVSPAARNTALAIFVLIPILPLLAAQVNYDGLLMLWAAALALLTFSLITQVRAGRIQPVTFVLFIVVCMLGCLTKYAFLPIAAGAALCVVVVGWRTLVIRLPQTLPRLWTDFLRLSLRMRMGLVVVLVIATGLFVQRYGVNLARYHAPVPDCSAVLSVEACKEWGPWARNHRMASERDTLTVNTNPLNYTGIWLQGLHYRMFFMINGPHHNYASYPPVPLPSATMVVLLISGLAAMAMYFRKIFKGEIFMVCALVIAGVYVLVLWLNNYSDFLKTGWPVAVNGRYLLPVLLLVAAAWIKAFAVAFRSWPIVKPIFLTAVIALFLQGGGVFSYMLRSDATWHWPNQTLITAANDTARKILGPITFEGPKYY